MILSHNALLAVIRQKRIIITPFDESTIGACSIDFSLSCNFRRFKKNKKPLLLAGGCEYEKATFPVVASRRHPLVVTPGEIVLGATAERLKLASGVCGWIQGRSKIARTGLSVHVSSSFIQPGSDNVQVLEIVNNAPFPTLLSPGVRVCQVVFEEVKGRATYNGTFAKQTKP